MRTPTHGPGSAYFIKQISKCVFYASHTISWWKYRTVKPSPGRCCKHLMQSITVNTAALLRAILKTKVLRTPLNHTCWLKASLQCATHLQVYISTAAWYSAGSRHNECMKVGVMGARIVHKTMVQLGPHDTLGWRDEGLLGLSPPPLFLYH